jgi:uncharacterized protein YllA (UPF0747 family)
MVILNKNEIEDLEKKIELVVKNFEIFKSNGKKYLQDLLYLIKENDNTKLGQNDKTLETFKNKILLQDIRLYCEIENVKNL